MTDVSNLRLSALILAVALLLPSAVAVDAAPSPSPSPTASPLPPSVPDAVTHRSIVLGGKTIAYTARAGTLTLRNAMDQPAARVFYTAYSEDGVAPARRAVTFLYNGGPGSSTIWLRMGSFGPVRVRTSDGTVTGPAPYDIGDNRFSLLDTSDLVFIDMPGSGFGRIIGAGQTKDFWGLDQDAAAFGQFIERYLTTFHRWNSPKFLFGESYGTTRSAVLASYLQDRGVGLNGIVLLSSFLNADIDYLDGAPSGGGDWAYVLYLPTETATAWYHHAIPNSTPLAPLLDEVRRFAIGEYLDALARGAQLPPDRFNEIVAKLSRYTGLSESYIRTSNLRIPYDRFDAELARDRGIVFGRLDSRFQSYVLDKSAPSLAWDATDTAIDSAFISGGNEYMRETMGYRTDLLYRAEIYDLIYADGKDWDFKHGDNVQSINVAPDLAKAMTYNPRLKIFSANGYFDFATPFFATEYVLDHLYLAPELRKNITYGYYESGHMVYLHPAALAKFHDDLERWYAATLSGH
jgi:carboxypeptidase C (cathepsin A)